MVNKLKELFKRSFEIFIESDRESILGDVNERNLCGRLSIHMSNLLQEYDLEDYFVDPEYNRKQDGEIKTILDENYEVVTINCDLILHSRGNTVNNDNLIALEMKKSSRPQVEKDNDRKRLRALTKSSFDDVWSADGLVHPEHVCNYKLGIYLELDIPSRIFLLEEYGNGVRQEARNVAF
ncbi:hypothetical protein [Candidatus Thiodiazotropha sp. LNASS1]|uniref:hypothetical protein n=1 Tax=Candidatus Thiodiazotropha sp. LNASS1 TaxID=3096260 RepID=UPI00346BD5B1